jgi:hypothetical protein
LAFYYSIAESHTTNGTANTESNVLRTATGATREAHFSRLVAGASGGAVDAQVWLKLWRMSVASTVGTAETPKPHDNLSPAAATTANLGATTGTKETNPAMQVAFNSRAMVQWVALNPDECHSLVAGGGANGNIDLLSEASLASVVAKYVLTFYEG